MDVKNKYNVSVISFKMTDSSGEQIYMLPFKNNEYTSVESKCVVYLPNDFMTNFSNAKKIFFHLSTYEKLNFDCPLLYQETAISANNIPKNGLLRLNFNMNFPSDSKPYKLVGYRFSVSDKDLRHQVSDIDENEGVFFDTIIPSEVIEDDR